MDRLLKVKEVAEALNMTPGGVRGLIKKGHLQGGKVGDEFRVPVKSLMEYMNVLTAPAQPALAEVFAAGKGNGNGNGKNPPPVKERPSPVAVPVPVVVPDRAANHSEPPAADPDPNGASTIIWTQRKSGPFQYIREVLGVHGNYVAFVRREDVAGRKLILWGSLPLPELASAAEVWYLQPGIPVQPDYRFDPSVETLKRWKCSLVRYFIES